MTEDLHSEERCIFASKEAAWAMLSRIYLYMSGTYETPKHCLRSEEWLSTQQR